MNIRQQQMDLHICTYRYPNSCLHLGYRRGCENITAAQWRIL